MKKIWCLAGYLLLCVLMLMGCGKEEQIVEGDGIYYLNTEGAGLVKKAYDLSDDSEEGINRVFGEMKKGTESIDYVSPFPDDVEIEEWMLKNTMMNVYFNVNYNNMNISSQVLLRAAIVQTFTQMENVEYIAFYAAGQPITDSTGKELGYLNDEDFIQNIGSTLHSYQEGELKLYFSSADGKKLVEETVGVKYNSNMSVEKLIIEKLIDGPKSSELCATFSTKTKILGVSVKDNVCYVNFDGNFLTETTQVDPKITIYSLVNSIVEGGNAMYVQILVNGETNVKYKESVDLSQSFSRDLNMIEEEKH